MRIVHLTEYFQPKLGYQEYYLAKEQVKLGHEVIIVTSDRFFPFHNFENTYRGIYNCRKTKAGIFTEEGLKVVRLPILFEFGHGSALYFRHLLPQIQLFQPDIIEVDGVFSIMALQIAITAEKLGIPLIYDSHASTFNTHLTDTIVKQLYYFFFKRIAIPRIKKSARMFLAVGESEKYLLCKEYQLDYDSVELIPLGADTELFKQDKNKRKLLRKKLGISADELIIVYAGKVEEGKDIHILIRAYAKIVRELSVRTKLLIIGASNSKYLIDLTQLVSRLTITNHVIFKPFVPHQQLPDYFSVADLGIWPGNFSNTIIEAMSTSLPIIIPQEVSYHHPTDNLVAYGNGMQFKRGDSADLSSTIKKMLLEKQLPLMGKRARKLVGDKFSWRLLAQRHLAAYNQVLGRMKGK